MKIIVYFVLLTFFSNLNAQCLFLNEMQTKNEQGIQDEDGDYGDWIEIYNSPTCNTVNIGGQNQKHKHTKPKKARKSPKIKGCSR